MGLFSSSSKTYVASSLWSLAGDPDSIPRVMPSIMLSAVMSNSKEGLGVMLSRSLRSTTFLRSRNFFSWAVDNYALGIPAASLGADFSVNDYEIGTALRTALGLGSNQEVEILSARVEEINIQHWAEDYLKRNRPLIDLELELEDGGWEVDYDTTTSEIVITLPAETIRLAASTDLLWALADTRRRLLYVAYEIHTETSPDVWTVGSNQLFTYRMGSGTAAFDALAPTGDDLLEFAPVIPLRIKNQSITTHTDYANIQKAYKKLTGSKIEDILDELEANDDLGDMDHVFVVQGISLNTKSPACKAYIYEFLKSLQSIQPVSVGSAKFFTNRGKEGGSQAAWNTFLQNTLRPPSNSKARNTGDESNALNVTMPELPEFDVTLRWGDISEETRIGNAARFDGDLTRPLAKKGSYLILSMSDLKLNLPATATGLPRSYFQKRPMKRIAILHQYETRRYRMLQVTSFEHHNRVYKNKTVKITAEEALEDTEVSGFLLPYHLPTVRTLGARDTAELTGHTIHLMVNSYKKVKKKWWQSGIFKIILVVVAIAFTVLTAGVGGLAAGAGLLGTNAAVGAMIGLTGVMGAVVGAVANGIAAVIFTNLLSKGAVELLGEKWGTILATVIAMVSMSMVMGVTNGTGIGMDMATAFRIDNLMKLTDAVTGTVGAWLQQENLEIVDAMTSAAESYEAKMEEIKEYSNEILGSTNVAFDATLLTDAAEQFGESSDSFLSRTLLTGSDLAEMSNLLVTGFVDLSLELPGPT